MLGSCTGGNVASGTLGIGSQRLANLKLLVKEEGAVAVTFRRGGGARFVGRVCVGAGVCGGVVGVGWSGVRGGWGWGADIAGAVVEGA